MTATISLIEVLWTLVGAFTLFVCARALRRALVARDVVQDSTRGREEKIALLLAVQTRIIVEALFCYIQVGFMIIGFYSMTRPPANPDPDQPQWGSILISIVFISIELGCLFVSVWVDRLRSKVIEMEDKRLGVAPSFPEEAAQWDETTRPL